ncbi:MAG: diacylglycerol kinase family lipid kinase [Clostridia bacterium]|nr:diacylglycerol kinase family lipid kinase [Clostridia bacterium]
MNKKPDVFRFIINPKAGRRDGSYLAGDIESVFAAASGQLDCQIILTERPGHATKLAADFAAQYKERLVVVACGGDGTAREVAQGLVSTPAAMSILPIGTANDFARVALSTCEISQLLPLLPDPHIRPIDAMAIDGEISLNITSIGFDTKVQMKAMQLNKQFRRLGNLSYPLAILLSLLGNRRYRLHYRLQTVEEDGSLSWVEQRSDIILAAICNGRYYGGGFNPAPNAKLDDGNLFFCLVDHLPLKRILELLPRYRKGTHLGDPAIHTWTVRSGEITAVEGTLLCNYDGDLFTRDHICFRVLPGAVNFAFY